MSQLKVPVLEIKKQSNPGVRPSTEVRQPRTRRVWSAESKLKVLQEMDDLPRETGAIGRYLRQNGLYASAVHGWRRERAKGELSSITKRRGPAPLRNADQIRIAELEKENARLQKKLDTSSRIIELQKKVAEILEGQS